MWVHESTLGLQKTHDIDDSVDLPALARGRLRRGEPPVATPAARQYKCSQTNKLNCQRATWRTAFVIGSSGHASSIEHVGLRPSGPIRALTGQPPVSHGHHVIQRVETVVTLARVA